MKLSDHFTLNELTKSQTALRLGIDNTPDDEQIENLKALCENILEPVRDKYGPLTPSSGFRSIPLCETIGSSVKSQHYGNRQFKAGYLDKRTIDVRSINIGILQGR